MRDLDRIKEVREFSITGPQLTSLVASALMLAAAVFAIGFQLGRLNSPVDLALLEPLGDSEQDAGTLLAEMLAEKEQTLTSTAAQAPAQLSASDESRPSEPVEPVEPVEPELAAREAEEPEATDAAPAKPVLTADELRTVGDEPVVTEPVPTLKTQDAGAPKLVVEKIERSFPEEAEAPPGRAPEPVAVVEVVEPAKPAVPDTSLPGAPAGTGYTVQVGAFESIEEAADTLRALKSKGHDAFHVSARVNGKTYHRVRVGLYPSGSEADEAAKRLAGATPHGTFVTQQP